MRALLLPHQYQYGNRVLSRVLCIFENVSEQYPMFVLHLYFYCWLNHTILSAHVYQVRDVTGILETYVSTPSQIPQIMGL